MRFRFTYYTMFLLFSIVYHVSCSNKGTIENVYDGIDMTLAIPIKIDVDIIDTLQASDIADSVWYVVLEKRDDAVIGSVDKLLFTDKKIFVVDKSVSETVFCYDREGNYLFHIYSKGRGPGEYIGIEDVDIDEKSEIVFIYSRSGRKLLKYDFTGSFIQSYQVSHIFQSFRVLPDSLIIAYINYEANTSLDGDQRASLFLFNYVQPSLNKSLLTYDKNLGLEDRVYRGINDFSIAGEILYLYDRFNNSIFMWKDGALSLLYKFDFGKQNIPTSFWSDPQKQSLFSLITSDSYIGGIDNLQVAGDWLVALYTSRDYSGVLFLNMKHVRVLHTREFTIPHNLFAVSNRLPLFINPPFHSDGKSLVTAIEPLWLKQIEARVSSHNYRDQHLDYPEALRNLPENSNPVLQFISMKSSNNQ